MKPLAGAARRGAGYGIGVVVFGTGWYALGGQAPVDWHELTTLLAIEAGGGAVMGCVLYRTRSFRARGQVEDYCCWWLAGAVAGLGLVLPEVLRSGWRFIPAAIALGGVIGFSFGAAARQVVGYGEELDRQGARDTDAGGRTDADGPGGVLELGNRADAEAPSER
jgi:hypothetical protein